MKNLLFTLSIAVLLTSNITVVGGGELFATGRLTTQVRALTSSLKQVGGKALVLVSLAAAACGLTGCSNEVRRAVDVVDGGEAVEVIKVGFSFNTYLYPQTLRAAHLAVEQINAAGGVNGAGMALIVRDNYAHGSSAYFSAKNSFVDQNETHAIVGPSLSYIAEVIDEIAQTSGIPMITTGAGSDGITAVGDYVFLGGFSDSAQGLALAKLATEDLEARTAAVLVLKYTLDSESLANAFSASFAALGGEVVVRYDYPNIMSSPSFFKYQEVLAEYLTAQIDTIKAANPDVIFVPGLTIDAAIVASVLRKGGITSTLLGGDKWGTGGLLANSRGVFEGAFFADHFAVDNPHLSAQAQQFIKTYTDKYGLPPDSQAALSFDGIKIVAEAIKQTGGNMDGEAVKNAIAMLTDYEGATLIKSYDENRIPVKHVIINTIRDNQIVYYKTFKQ